MKSPFKSIKVKLTLWYSLVLMIVSLVLVGTINSVIAYYYRTDPIEEMFSPFVLQHQISPRLRDLTEESRELIIESRNQDLRTIREISILSFVPLTILSFGGGYLIADQMLRPLKKLNTTMSTITSEQLKTKIEFEDTGDEISELIENFNDMIGRLNASFDSQRQFVENASHELKTPLAVIHTNLEAALSESKLTKEEIRELLEAALSSSKFMQKLLDDLLLLAILNERIEKKKQDLKNIVSNSISQINSLAKEKKIRIEMREPKSPLKIKGNAVLLQRAFMNLIENGIKYSPRNSTVSIKLYSTKQSVKVSITDSGEGIPREHRKLIFERFYRIDKSRSRKTGGTGLGLSISKDVIESHGGNLTLRSGKMGSTFLVSLPKIS